MQNTFGITDPFTSAVDMPIALSAFHTSFNLINVLLLLGFVPLLVRIATWSVKSKGEEDDEVTRLRREFFRVTPPAIHSTRNSQTTWRQ